MKKYIKIISFTGIGLAAISAVLVFKGIIPVKTHFTMLTIGMVLWYATAPFWQRSKSLADEEYESYPTDIFNDNTPMGFNFFFGLKC